MPLVLPISIVPVAAYAVCGDTDATAAVMAKASITARIVEDTFCFFMMISSFLFIQYHADNV